MPNGLSSTITRNRRLSFAACSMKAVCSVLRWMCVSNFFTDAKSSAVYVCSCLAEVSDSAVFLLEQCVATKRVLATSNKALVLIVLFLMLAFLRLYQVHYLIAGDQLVS